MRIAPAIVAILALGSSGCGDGAGDSGGSGAPGEGQLLFRCSELSSCGPCEIVSPVAVRTTVQVGMEELVTLPVGEYHILNEQRCRSRDAVVEICEDEITFLGSLESDGAFCPGI